MNQARAVKALAALGIVGAMLPLGPAAHAAGRKPAYSGFATTAKATPVHIEVYEPTVPIPADPQAELSLGYSTVEADSSSSRARASYLWPGDAVGEGFKTIVENLGLPEEVAGPLAEGGYPAQVNADSQSQQEQRDEPFPGMVMRARAADDHTVAQTGYSTDCEVADDGGDDSGDGSGGGGGGGDPAVPGVPGLPGLPLPTPSGGASTASGSGSDDGGSKKSEDPSGDSSCQIPAELKALVDFGGYISTSDFTNTGRQVSATSRAALSDVSLLGGMITVSDVHTGAVALSNGRQGDPRGRSGYGTLAIGPQEFTIGPDGVEAAGQSQKIPGLPDDPAKALAELGVTITAPSPKTQRHGAQAQTDAAGLVVTLDTAQLRSKLDAIPFDEIVSQIPDQAGDLKKALGAAVHLSPKFVITLADAHSAVDTVQPITFPTAPVTGGGHTGGGAPAGSGGGSRGAGLGAGVGSGAPTGAPGAGGVASADGTLGDAAPAAAGLPPLYSLPGALLLGGIALASVAGSYLRKVGALALGGAGSCSHGLDSGLPDLRKA